MSSHRAASCARMVAVGLSLLLIAPAARGENRTYSGTGNNLLSPLRGAANMPVIRVTYPAFYLNSQGAMITDAQRPNARTISNAISAQSGSIPSARGLSDYIWAWGQFLDHDMSLSTASDGAMVNGTAHIAVNDPGDPLGPNPIPFVRSNFSGSLPPFPQRSPREQINEVTSYIDASHIYGSSADRAALLRDDGGRGAKLRLSAEGLLPLNTLGVPMDNDGPLADDQMFLAGDVRANENVLLTSLQTVFAREHNRLVDRISQLQPELGAEAQYQLARKIVGAEMQIVTYREFLPALMGPGAPRADLYNYVPQVDASVTNSFAHSAYRFGHSQLSPNLHLVAEDGTADALPLRNAFFNPTVLSHEPAKVDDLLRGAARQVSQEVDVHLVDDVRNFLFGPPGAGGLDLAALNIQRGRDHGLPDYRRLGGFYNAPTAQSFSALTSNPELAAALQAVYANDIGNVDPWIGGLAEDHLQGASVGRLNNAILFNQFSRTRDGDRLFYLSNAAGLYTNRVLNPEIEAIVDLDALTLKDIIEANTGVAGLQQNVFFVTPGDLNFDNLVDAADMDLWCASFGGTVQGDVDWDGDVDGRDFLAWQRRLGTNATMPGPGPRGGAVPEPAGAVLAMLAVGALGVVARRRDEGARRAPSHDGAAI